MLLLITFFDKSKQLIKHHSQNTQDDNAEHHVIQSEDLAAVDNEIPQAGIGCQKFADNDTHQTEADIDFQVADDGGDACGQNNIAQNVPAGAAKGFDQQQFVAVNVDKGCIQIIVLKMAMVTPQTIMVFMLFPSHTIRIGARAVFGRLLRTTK